MLAAGSFGAVSLAATSAGAAGETCNGLPATIVGTAAGETLTGTPGNDVIVALGGNDTISGLAGHDTVCAGEGNDYVNGGVGNDAIFGEGGNDRLEGGKGLDTIDGGAGDDIVKGQQDNDTLGGGSGHDTLAGGIGDDSLGGGDGFDVCDPANDPDSAGVNTYMSCEVVQFSETTLVANPPILVAPLTVYGFSAQLTTAGGVPIPGRTVTFTADGETLCSGVTNESGVASCSANLPVAVVTTLLNLGVDGSFAGGEGLGASSDHAFLIGITPEF